MAALTGDGWTTSPPVGDSLRLRVEEQSAAAGVRRRVTALAERLGFAGERLEQVRLAATEAATNLVEHARQGEMLVRIVRDDGRAVLEFVALDRGPGIADVPVSRLDGFSTRGTLGLGLGSIERLADGCGMYSPPQTGTVLYARFRPPGAAAHPDAAEPPFSGLTVPIEGEEECGDAYTARLVDGTVYALLCDGLGHGPLAARAAVAAVRAAHETALPAPVSRDPAARPAGHGQHPGRRRRGRRRRSGRRAGPVRRDRERHAAGSSSRSLGTA